MTNVTYSSKRIAYPHDDESPIKKSNDGIKNQDLFVNYQSYTLRKVMLHLETYLKDYMLSNFYTVIMFLY